MCTKRKTIGASKAPLQPLLPVYEIWERIAMDIGPVRESRKGYRYILVISDYASHFVLTIPMTDQTARNVARCLVHKIITKYGAPQHVLTNRGTNFLSTLRRPPVLPNDIKIDQKYEKTGDDTFMYTKKWMQAQKIARKHLLKAQEKQKFTYNLGTLEAKYEIED